jgi:FtsP/CotA-like multicopper oxidase with cupredoxin domain
MRRRECLRTGLMATAGTLAAGPASRLLAQSSAATTLVAASSRREIWPGQPTTVLTLGDAFPSRTLRVRRWDMLDVELQNDLREPTNIHWHGLAAPPEDDGHPMDVVLAGGRRAYRFLVEEPAGTYWYHPHPDGRTASQVYRGLAGFLIVEDEAERALGLPAGEFDLPLLLQDRRRRADGSLTYAPTFMDLMAGMLGDAGLVNGAPQSVVEVAATSCRLRLLNGSNARVMRVAFEDARRFDVIAGDCGLLDQAVAASEVWLAPGERAEILVDFSGDPLGRAVRLVSAAFSSGGPGMGMGGGAGQGAFLPLATFRVSATGPAPTRVPERLATVARLDPGRASVRRRFAMDMQMPPGPGAFTINGLGFEPDRVDVKVERGVQEAWEVVNLSGEPHPFHVHGTQFQVVRRSSAPALLPHERGLKDTVLVWPGETVELAIRFERHAGLYVLHCHNLEHEDAGMMLNLEVI